MSINGFSDFNKDYFDQSFKKNINHWEYDKIQFRILKHVREWSAIKDSNYKYACEIGCAAGVFTKYLKKICRKIDAFDISPTVINSNKLSMVSPQISWEVLNFKKNYKTLDYSKYYLILLNDILHYFSKNEIRDIFKHISEQYKGKISITYHFTDFIKGLERYTFNEMNSVLHEYFCINKVLTIQLKSQGGIFARFSNIPFVRKIHNFIKKIDYLYSIKRLEECDKALLMGAFYNDINVVGWFLETKLNK